MKIRKTKAGTYTTQIAIKDENGKFHSKRFTRPTKKELQAVVLEYQTNNRIYRDSKRFGDCLQRYLDKKGKVLSPSTMKGYEAYQSVLADNYKEFLDLTLDEITAAAIQTLVNDLRSVRKAKTVKNYTGLISSVLKDNDYKMPKFDMKKEQRKFAPNVPTAEIVQKIAATAKGTRWELPFALACMGLRRSGVSDFRLHDCRHFFASYCHDVLHLSDAQIQKLGGWSTDYVMKRVYITSITDEKKTVETAFEKMFT